ncbi:MAG: hypothetical protein JNK34_06205 [Tabrizicola sp.]|nr:hypothetical protein [Tabrizicola sp.]
MINLHCDSHGIWTTELTLPEWAGFQSRLGPFAAIDRDGPSDGKIRLSFGAYGRESGPLGDRDLLLIRWFEVNHARQAPAVLAAILAAMPLLRATQPDETGLFGLESSLPGPRTATDLRGMIGLHHVLIHQLDHAGQPYVGYVFGCDWDDGQGLGVLMHGSRAVEVGGSDVAFLMWIAERDAQKSP